MKPKYLMSVVLMAVLMSGCSSKIAGVVSIADMNMQPLTDVSREGLVVNIMNTSGSLENASHSVSTDVEGKYTSAEGKIVDGTYKVEVTKFGYMTDTQTVQIDGSGTREVNLVLKKIMRSKRRSIRASDSDADKIVNPGEVNIQPPGM